MNEMVIPPSSAETYFGVEFIDFFRGKKGFYRKAIQFVTTIAKSRLTTSI